jgi:integrase
MPLKKHAFGEDEQLIFDDAIIYQRDGHWQFRMWLPPERKYVRKTLNTRHRSTAIERGKDLYLRLYADMRQGKSYFSITAREGVARYVQHRQRDVEAGLIVKGRLITIKAHLKHWLAFVGADSRLAELERNACEDYYRFRVSSAQRAAARQTTIVNEQATINAMMSWLFRQGDARIDSFEFRKLPRLDKNDEGVRRSTFEAHEVVAIREAIDCYCDSRQNRLDDDEWRQRSLAGHYFLIAAATGLRTGEQLQLRWSDLRWSQHHSQRHGGDVELVEIRVRAETSKVRTSRRFFCKDEGLFARWLKIAARGKAASTLGDNFVFSLDGLRVITKRALLYHFEKIVKLAGIERTGRNLVPYSFRHFFITQKIMGGLGYQQVAEMCGTSVSQIERTYFHLNDSMRITNALAGYEIDDDGLVVAL